MSSRDRFVEDNPFAKEIERRLEEALHDHRGLHELKARRAAADLEKQMADNKPLEDVLKRVLRTSPALARLFGTGVRLHNPFTPIAVEPVKANYVGKPHPTFFRFHGKPEGVVLRREAFMGRRIRIRFETDVENDYFTRQYDRGHRRLERIWPDGRRVDVSNFTGPTLNDGSAALTFDLPDNVTVDETVSYELTVSDSVTGGEFRNRAELIVRPEAELPPRPAVDRRQPGKTSKTGIDGPSGIELPRIYWIPQPDPQWNEHFSSTDDCLDVLDDGEPDDSGRVTHDYSFYLNEHNRALRFELSTNKLAAAAVKKQFEIAVTLVGLALLQESDRQEDDRSDDVGESSAGSDLDVPRERVKRATRALAPILLPLINTLSDLGQFEADESDLVGVAA